MRHGHNLDAVMGAEVNAKCKVVLVAISAAIEMSPETKRQWSAISNRYYKDD